MAIVDLIMQKKGGVGKSVCAALLCQALMEAGTEYVGVDTDPSNKSLAAYKELPITWVNLLSEENDDDIDRRLFDSLISSICEMQKPDSHVVIDVGSSNFQALRSYLKATAALDLLMDLGHEVRLHVIIAGGGGILGETCDCLGDLAKNFPRAGLAPWLNPYEGLIFEKGRDGGENMAFEDFLISREFGDRYLAIVKLPERCRNSLFRGDLQDHFSKFVTFRTAISSPKNHIMVRQRLKIFWDEARTIIASAGLL